MTASLTNGENIFRLREQDELELLIPEPHLFLRSPLIYRVNELLGC